MKYYITLNEKPITCHKRGSFRHNAELKNPSTKLCFLRFHVYKTKKEAKLVCSAKHQDNHYPAGEDNNQTRCKGMPGTGSVVTIVWVVDTQRGSFNNTSGCALSYVHVKNLLYLFLRKNLEMPSNTQANMLLIDSSCIELLNH